MGVVPLLPKVTLPFSAVGVVLAVFTLAVVFTVAFPLPVKAQTPGPYVMLRFDTMPIRDYSGFSNSVIVNPYSLESELHLSKTKSISGGSSLYIADYSKNSFLVKSGYYPDAPKIIDAGIGDFTIDFWIYPTKKLLSEHPDRSWELPLADIFFSMNPAGLPGKTKTTNTPIILGLLMDRDNLYFQQMDQSDPNDGVGKISFQIKDNLANKNFRINEWNHIAIMRLDTKFNMAINGELGAWRYDDNWDKNFNGIVDANSIARWKDGLGQDRSLDISGKNISALPLDGFRDLNFSKMFWADGRAVSYGNYYIDEVRITKGSALWPLVNNDSFPPPTSYPPPEVVPVITVSDPGGKTYNWGDDIKIRWTLSNVSAQDFVELSLRNEQGDYIKHLYFPYNNDRLYTWVTSVDSTPLASGKYFIQADIYKGGALFSGRSDYFTINPATINVIAPVATDTFNQKASIPVTWDSPFLSENTWINIALLKPNGDLVMKKTYYSNKGSGILDLSEAPPAPGDYFIRVGLRDSNVIFDLSDSFAITGFVADAAKINVTAPVVGTFSGSRGDVIPIHWESFNMSANASITLSLRNEHGAFISDIGYARNTDSYDFETQWAYSRLAPGNGKYLIQVGLSDSNVIFGRSAPFTITKSATNPPAINVTAPVGVLKFNQGDIIPVHWTSSNISADSFVMIWLKDNTDDDLTYIGSVKNTGSYDLETNLGSINPSPGDYRIHVGFYRDGLFSGQSNVFTINPAAINVTAPVATDTFNQKANIPVTWNSSNISPGTWLNIDLFNKKGDLAMTQRTNQNSRNDILDLSAATPPPGKYLIKVGMPNSNVVFGQSAPFTITGSDAGSAKIIVTEPSGKVFSKAAEIPIRWASSNISAEALIDLSLRNERGGFEKRIDSVKNTGSYDWKTQLELRPPFPGDYLIKVGMPNSNLVFGQSAPFTITGSDAGSFKIITVTEPVAGSVFNPGYIAEIKWNSSDIPTGFDPKGVLFVELFDKNNVEIQTGQYKWVWNTGKSFFDINAPPGDGYYIKVSLPYTNVFGKSAPFKVNPATITVTAPVATDTFDQSAIIPVKWNSSNNISVYKGLDIELFNAAGDLVKTRSWNSNDGDDSLNLRGAPPPPGDYYIKVSLPYTNISGQSDPFTITGSVAGSASITDVIVPSNENAFNRGGPITFRWTASNISVSDYNWFVIELFKNGDVADVVSVKTRRVEGGLLYVDSLTAPLIPGDYYIKVSLPYTNISGQSGPFSITTDVGSSKIITVTAPADGDTFDQNATIPVAWKDSFNLSDDTLVSPILYNASNILVTAWDNEGVKNSNRSGSLNLGAAPPPPGRYYIEVVSFDPYVSGRSDWFNITGSVAGSAKINVTSPVATDTFDQGAIIPVTWTSSNISTDKLVTFILYKGTRIVSWRHAQPNSGSGIFNFVAAPLTPGQYFIKVNLISTNVSGQSDPFTVTGVTIPQTPLASALDIDVTDVPSSLLLHFDKATPSYEDSSGNNSLVTAFQNVSLPDFTSADKKFGAGAVSFNGKKEIGQQQALAVHSANSNLTFGDDDFTIDFWVYPDKLEDGTILFYLDDESGNTDKRLTLFVDSSGWLDLQSGATSLAVKSGLQEDAWNHIAIQRKKVETVTSVSLAVKGKLGNWVAVDSVTNPLLSGVFKILGFGWPYESAGGNSKAFQGKIDEFRIVNGKALWGAVADGGSFTVPSAPAISVSTIILPSILGGEVIHPEAAGTTEQPTLPALAETALSREAQIRALTEPERLDVREMLIKKVNGDRNYTVYFDANDEHLKTIFWEDNTSDKKLKEFEYDALGGLYREKYYNRDIAETDIISYYPRAEGGGIKQDVKKRQQGGAVIETLSNFDAGGHLTHTQQYRGEELLFAKTFSYNGDNLTSDLFYAGVNNWEKNEYKYNGADLSKITNTRRLPAAPEGSTSVIFLFQTTSLFTGGKLTSARRISAPLEGAANKVEDISYRDDGQITRIDIFDFEHNVKTHIPYQEIATGKTAPEYEYNVTVTTEDLMAYTKYRYESGGLKSKDEVTFLDNNVSKFGTITTYSTKGKKIRETILTYQPSTPGEQLLFSTQTVRYFDDEGREAWKMVFSYRVGAATPYEEVIYNGAGLITMVADIANNNFTSKKWYYGSKTADAANQWFEINYLYGGDAPLTIKNYYIGAGARVLANSGDYRPNQEKKQYELIAGSKTVNKLAEKELGDAIVASLNLTATGELPRIAQAVKKILLQYQTALGAPGLTDAEKDELYVKFVQQATYAIYSIEYKTWTDAASPTKDLTKGLTDDSALEGTVTEWVGIDGTTGVSFKGLYIFPGSSATIKLATDAAYVDFSEGGLTDSISKAGSYEDLKSITKKSEKWDAIPGAKNEVVITTAGQMAVYNEVSGGYLTVDELTKRDPSIMLLVDRLFADLEAKKVTLPGNDEKETIKKVYEYFFNKSLFIYLWDLGGTIQTVGQTFARGGGNSGDFAAVFLSILREVFYRLGNSDIQSRLSFAPVMVSEFASISAQNIGAGHGGMTYDEPAAAGGKLYYIEPSYLFKGGGTLYYDNILMELASSFPLEGKNIPTVKTNAINDHSWYVALDTTNAIRGTAKQYRTTSLFTPQNPVTVSLADNSSEKVASIPSYIEPYDANVNDLANYFIRYIPDMDARSPEFIAEYIHSEFSKLTEYKADGGTDVWTPVSQTLAGIIGTKVNPILHTNGTLTGNKIIGDCEDLAFAEASVLQNILTKYYMRLGFTAYNAAAKAQSQIFLLAERDYKGIVANDSHLYVAFVSEPRGTVGTTTTIMILDPQDGSITPSLPFEIVLNDKYLFYANSSKVSAISFYDWSALRLSAAVGGTLQQAIDAVNGVRPAADFKFSERAQSYIQELQTTVGQAARDEITLMSEAAANTILNNPQSTFAEKEKAAEAILITAGAKVAEEPIPVKADTSFPKQTAKVVASFLKGVAKAVSNLIGTVIPGYGAPPLPPSGKTYSGEPAQPYDIIPDPNFDYYSAVGNQKIIDPSQTLDNLEYYSAIGNTVLRTEQREPSAEIPTTPPLPFTLVRNHSVSGEAIGGGPETIGSGSIKYDPATNTLYVADYIGESGSLQCKSQYYVCERDYEGYGKSYGVLPGTTNSPPANAQWLTKEDGFCSTTEFSCDKRVYHMDWKCNEGWSYKNVNGNKDIFENDIRDSGDSCVRYTEGDPQNSPPTQPQICGPTKGLLSTEYEYAFESTDSDRHLSERGDDYAKFSKTLRDGSPNPKYDEEADKASRIERNEPYFSDDSFNKNYNPTKGITLLPFISDTTNGKLFYDIKIGARLIDNFSLPPYDADEGKHRYTVSGKKEDTKKTALLSWSDAGAKNIEAFAQDSSEAISATSILPVTIGENKIQMSTTKSDICGSGIVTVNWPAINGNTLTPDGFKLLKKEAGEPDTAFTLVADFSPSTDAATGLLIPNTTSSFIVTGLNAGQEYVFAIAPFVSNNCGGTFTLATATTSVAAPARCAMPDLTANPPSLSDQYGNATGGENGNVLGAGNITIRGTINNSGGAATPDGAFGNLYEYKTSGILWSLLQEKPLKPANAISAGGSGTVDSHSWTGGVGTWDFRLTTDTNNAVVEESEGNNTSEPTAVDIVDYATTLAANPTTALAVDTVTFTASATREGFLTNPEAVAFSNPQCGVDGTVVSVLTASTANDTSASFSCSYSTPGPKTATVFSSYYRIPKTASAEVTVLPELQTSILSCTEGAGKIKVWLKKKASGAVSYALHRGSTLDFAPDANNQIDVNPVADGIQGFTSANVPTTPAGAFVDTGLAPKSNYYYKIVALGLGGAASSVSAAATDNASARCPDLVVESIALPNSPGLSAGTVLSESTGHIFSAVIKNVGEGTEATKAFLNQISVNGITVLADRPNLDDQPITGGLAEGLTKTIISGSWLAPSVTRQETRAVKVCADQPPVPPDRGNVIEANSDGTPAELNNCLEIPISIAPPPITVQLECENQGGTYENDYCVIDYAQTSKLRWTIGGVPSSCKWVQSDISGDAAKQSYTVTGNPLSLTNLLDKLSFKYQLDCSR